MRFVILSVTSVLMLMMTSTTARADIIRHCEGEIRSIVNSGVKSSGDQFVAPATDGHVITKLKGRGRCENRREAGKCRERARTGILACAQSLWAVRWDRRVPYPQCSFSRGPAEKNAHRSEGSITWWNTIIHRNDIKSSIEFEACCKQQPTARSLHLSVRVESHGDNNCHYSHDLVGQTYQANCTRLRARGLCEKPVSEWGAVRDN